MAGQARRSERKQHSPSHGCRALRGALWTASARRCCTRSVVLRCEVARWCQARLAGPAKQCVLGGAPTRCFSDCVFALSFRRWIPAGRRWASAAAHRYAGIEATRGHRAAELEEFKSICFAKSCLLVLRESEFARAAESVERHSQLAMQRDAKLREAWEQVTRLQLGKGLPAPCCELYTFQLPKPLFKFSSRFEVLKVLAGPCTDIACARRPLGSRGPGAQGPKQCHLQARDLR